MHGKNLAGDDIASFASTLPPVALSVSPCAVSAAQSLTLSQNNPFDNPLSLSTETPEVVRPATKQKKSDKAYHKREALIASSSTIRQIQQPKLKPFFEHRNHRRDESVLEVA